jgi:hypothetical protein
MLTLDRVYLAHEYLDEHWNLFQFSDVVAMLGEAKLAFVASASLLENLDQYAVPASLAALVGGTADPIMRETLRDYCSGKRFRRDLFARGSAALTPAEHRRLLSGLRFVLTVPRQQVSFKFAGPLMELTAKTEMHAPIVDLLARKIADFDELLAAFPGNQLGLLLDCLACLVHSGQVAPIVAEPAADKEPAQRFNRLVVDSLKAGRIYNALASPVIRTGLSATEFDLLTLAAVLDGQGDNVAIAARHALALIVNMGRQPIKEGKLLDNDKEALAFLEDRLHAPLTRSVPIWRRLGIL